MVANPSASGVGSPNVLASEGVGTPVVRAGSWMTGLMHFINSQVNSHPLVPMARDGRSHAGAGQSSSARDEYGFLVPYYPPDFYCGDLRVGLEVLELQVGEERGRGSPPDELLLVGGVQAGLNRAEQG